MKIGDRIICVDVSDHDLTLLGEIPQLVRGREYIVYNKQICKCGIVALDVGLIGTNDIHICDCGKNFTPNGIHWCGAYRFRKVEEKKQYRVVKSSAEIEEPILN